MKPSRIFILACVPVLLVNLLAVIYSLGWLEKTSEISIYLLLLAGFSKSLNFKNINVVFFLVLGGMAVILNLLAEDRFTYFTMFFQMSSYLFLSREALKHTQREAANKFMLVFFFLMLSANCYFIFRHVQEMGSQLGGVIEFSFYLLYYINLMVLVVIGLVYYLNSYSRKSVFFISMVMAIVVADILRDMVLYYLSEISVIMLHNFLKFSAVILSFQFYALKERKLKLINLV